jgi:hypothetical protein
MANEEDWRLRGQEVYLQGATLIRKSYKAWSDEWEHDHCEFCWAKFMDPSFSPEHKRFISEDPEILTEGYAVHDRRPDSSSSALLGRVFGPDGVTEHKEPSGERDGYWWVCPNCVADFTERFEWTVIDERRPLTS